jgi:hypothetical protein
VFNSKRPFNGFLTVFTYWLAVNSDYLDNSLAPKGPVFIYPVIHSFFLFLIVNPSFCILVFDSPFRRTKSKTNWRSVRHHSHTSLRNPLPPL